MSDYLIIINGPASAVSPKLQSQTTNYMSAFTKEEIVALFRQSPIVPVFYNGNADHAKAMVKACYDGGFRLFEFTNRGTEAWRVFAELVSFVREQCPDMALGIGTILTADDARDFIELGADFVVQPITTPAVADVCHANNILWMPAGATLNEIYQATLLGAEIVKVFPGNVVGPGFVRAVKGPMPNLKLMVTGGVEPNKASLTEWFQAGVWCVGIGSQLFSGGVSPETVRTRVAQLMTIIQPYLPKPA